MSSGPTARGRYRPREATGFAPALRHLTGTGPIRPVPSPPVQRYGFLLRRKWVILTVLVVIGTFAMVWAGFWQLRRLHGRQAMNNEIRARTEAVVSPASQWLPAGESLDDAKRDAEWRVVQATGTYDPAGQVLIRNRSFDGSRRATTSSRPCGWLTARRCSSTAGGSRSAPRSASRRTSPRRRRAPSPSKVACGAPRSEGRSARPTRATVSSPSSPASTSPVFDSSSTYPRAPAYVELTAQEPAPSQPLPRLIPLPELDDGPHFAYAVQWFIFSTLAVVGWVLVVRRQLKQDERDTRPEGSCTPEPGTRTSGIRSFRWPGPRHGRRRPPRWPSPGR